MIVRRVTLDRAVWTKPLAFAADAVELWGLNRLSGVRPTVLANVPSIGGDCGWSCPRPSGSVTLDDLVFVVTAFW